MPVPAPPDNVVLQGRARSGSNIDLIDQVYSLLVRRGADQNAKNAGGLTPLALVANGSGSSADQFDMVFKETRQKIWEFGTIGMYSVRSPASP